MVNLGIPDNYTFSPCERSPHLTINHEVAADLDSTNAFEGPEKLLEVWFAPSPRLLPPSVKEGGLKAVSPSTWEGMLDLVKCKILSIVRSEHVDAYLLSESSMFVFPHKLILKTCGTTTLLLGLRRLLRIAAVDAGFPFHNATSLDDVRVAATPYRVFYSRKNFLFPHRQRGPHSSWKDEVKFLDDTFENGSAYMVGRMNADHWYLYMTSPVGNTLTPPLTPSSSNGGSPTRSSKIPTGIITFPGAPEEQADETLEILMMDLDPELAKQFYLEQASAVADERVPAQAREARRAAHDSLGDIDGQAFVTDADHVDVFANSKDLDGAAPNAEQADIEARTTEGHALGTVVSDMCGLSQVYPKSAYPDSRIDAYLFTPCGFSANGVVPAPVPGPDGKCDKLDHYWTVHVTPEPVCSYASFETNVPGGQNGRATSEVINHVVSIFKPGRFTMTLFQAKKPADDDSLLVAPIKHMDTIKGYRRMDRIVHDFDDYYLIFRYYEREGWTGDGQARVGEDH
ncbi:S-adenosylmethionine decarboxylase proenzyme-like protein [Thermochaetoides thermophila DSM 1495]|uniref:adenosylmethionine decarboxylase n=1 Tax=Chaetomium thermophilum (strain DSM 1495 / CBS 144.50 / IMI 039719) TaxID=759272 RepID=G0SH87_CHATD|nr:S-adenosylmethionine decarboxylase proenzyme-like protein [Thermochaetoides thermophila DSM 1495]EGS17576.1 S-adenosylmethionine decarboxylase proenzyme-like protein [Thermochaetoides thermophila DSM 1495]